MISFQHHQILFSCEHFEMFPSECEHFFYSMMLLNGNLLSLSHCSGQCMVVTNTTHFCILLQTLFVIRSRFDCDSDGED